MCRRALGALLAFFILTPLPALCAACFSDQCPIGAMASPSEADDREAREEQGHCHAGNEASATEELQAVAADCCDPEAMLGAPAVLTTQLQNLAFPVAARGYAPPLTVPTGASAAPREAPPLEVLRPLYTLNSSLLI